MAKGPALFPALRVRLMILLTIVAGGASWQLAHAVLRSPDGTGALSLFDAGVAWPVAVMLTLAAGIPALVLGVVTGAIANPLAGVFSVAGALCVFAGAGGSAETWLRRAASRGGYVDLIVETLIWQVAIVGFALLAQMGRRPLRDRFTSITCERYHGKRSKLALPDTQAIGAGLTSACAAGMLGMFLLRTADVGQIIGALILAFLIGGMAGQLIFPQDNPLPLLLSPGLLALAVYGYVLLRFDSQNAILEAWFTRTASRSQGMKVLPGLALALPVHYASAALVGVTMGVGLAQAMTGGDKQARGLADVAFGAVVGELGAHRARQQENANRSNRK